MCKIGQTFGTNAPKRNNRQSTGDDMRRTIKLISTASALALALAIANPAAAAPGDKMGKPGGNGGGGRQMPQARPAPQAKPAGSYNKAQPSGGRERPASMGNARPAGYNPSGNKAASYDRPGSKPVASYDRPGNKPGASYDRPGNKPGASYDRPGNKPGGANDRPGNNNRPGYKPGGNNDININNNTNVNVSGNNRYPNNNYANRYPVYRPPGGGYYRPPNGGYYGPPRPPYGGWHGGYYPPPRYYYNDGPSVGGVLFGVAVTTSLLALLSAANQPDVIYVQGAPPPPLPAYQPPRNTSGAPATINVDINSMTASARPSASVCLTEAARQIGATGGSEIRIGDIVNVEPGNGGYRFQFVLVGVYPDETRNIPMYCRATSEKIVELTFG
jgi:hypothetical protein